MSERIDALYDYGRYDDMAFPYSHDDLEEDFPIHFPNRFDKYQDFLEDPEPLNDDFWDSDPCFWSIDLDEEWKRMEELTAQADARAEDEDREFFRFETAPLRHTKNKRVRRKKHSQRG